MYSTKEMVTNYLFCSRLPVKKIPLRYNLKLCVIYRHNPDSLEAKFEEMRGGAGLLHIAVINGKNEGHLHKQNKHIPPSPMLSFQSRFIFWYNCVKLCHVCLKHLGWKGLEYQWFEWYLNDVTVFGNFSNFQEAPKCFRSAEINDTRALERILFSRCASSSLSIWLWVGLFKLCSETLCGIHDLASRWVIYIWQHP